MLKKDNLVWLYFIGIIVMLVIIYLVGKDYAIPVLTGRRRTEIDTGIVFEKPPKYAINSQTDYRTRLVTDFGTITVDLFETSAPMNVNNFIFLAQQHYYDGTLWHRLVPGLFIQGGDRNTLNDDPADDGFGSPGYLVKDEINWEVLGFTEDKQNQLKSSGYQSNNSLVSRPLRKYALAMASNGPNTNGSQFFIILAEDNDPRLQEMSGKFTVIGEVIFGREILLNMGSTEINATDQLVPRPIRNIFLRSVEVFTN